MIDRRSPSRGLTSFAGDDRAVSELVAFVLVFGVILSSVALLSVTGFQAMDDYQEVEQQRNAERAVTALAENFNDVARYDGVERRYGELSLRGGTLRTGDSGTKVNITVEPAGESAFRIDGTDRFADYDDDATVDLGEFTYDSDGARFAYEGGAVVQGDDSEEWSIVRKRPLLTCNDDRNVAMLSFVAVSADDRSIRSDGQLGVSMTVENRSSAVYDDVETVTVAVDDETAYDDAWVDAFDSGDWNGSGLERECADLDRVVITIVETDIQY